MDLQLGKKPLGWTVPHSVHYSQGALRWEPPLPTTFVLFLSLAFLELK